jgi:hypothetical protein
MGRIRKKINEINVYNVYKVYKVREYPLFWHRMLVRRFVHFPFFLMEPYKRYNIDYKELFAL